MDLKYNLCIIKKLNKLLLVFSRDHRLQLKRSISHFDSDSDGEKSKLNY